MFVAIYTTFDDLNEAKNIGHLLIKKKLAACVNILQDVHSIYCWKGKIEETTEIILWCKTQDYLIEKVHSVIQEFHTYDLPAFIAYPIHTGSEAYLKWISDEIQPLNIN